MTEQEMWEKIWNEYLVKLFLVRKETGCIHFRYGAVLYRDVPNWLHIRNELPRVINELSDLEQQQIDVFCLLYS